MWSQKKKCWLLIEKLESQLEAGDLIKLELNGNLAPDSIALSNV